MFFPNKKIQWDQIYFQDPKQLFSENINDTSI